MENEKVIQELLDVKVELSELKMSLEKAISRIEELERREMGGGVYLDGVPEAYRSVIEESRNRKR